MVYDVVPEDASPKSEIPEADTQERMAKKAYAKQKKQKGANKKKDSCMAKITAGRMEVAPLKRVCKFVTQKNQGSSQPEERTRSLRNKTRESYILLLSA